METAPPAAAEARTSNALLVSFPASVFGPARRATSRRFILPTSVEDIQTRSTPGSQAWRLSRQHRRARHRPQGQCADRGTHRPRRGRRGVSLGIAVLVALALGALL